MKTYWRLLSFVRPIGPFVTVYFLFSLFYALFNAVNLTLLIPLLDVLFSQVKPDLSEHLPYIETFSFSIDYFVHYFKYHLTSIVIKYEPMVALQFVCVLFAVCVLMANIFRYLQVRMKEQLRSKMSENLREAMFNNLTAQHIGYYSDQRKGDIISRAANDAFLVEYTITGSLALFIKEPLFIIFYFGVLFYNSVELTLFSITVIPIIGSIIALLAKSLRKKAHGLQESQGNLLTMLDEVISGLRVVKAFNGTPYVQKKYLSENRFYASTLRKFGYRAELASPMSEFLAVVMMSGLVLYGGNLILSGTDAPITASIFIAYIAVFSQVIRPIKGITKEYSNLQRGIASGDRVLSLIDAQSEITDRPDAKSLTVFKDKIEFQNVSFAYAKDPVLKNLSFSIEKGKTIALVGPSGGGKSTIADLVPRFYDVVDGAVFIDGVDVRDYKLDDVRQQLGVVTQESILFNDTLFNNIAFGRPDAQLEDVIKAAKIANAHDFIMNTENGYNTVIGDRGAKLSGGQRQRISIARAIFKNPAILILDEATSALDTESEKLVQDALNKLMQNRTSLVIAHRLSTIQNADEILVINQGEIVERGTHFELLEHEGGLYKKLNALQTTN
ncbi:MAG: ABC transporter ATP-binding protein [Flammeovirgaceae bacterium]